MKVAIIGGGIIGLSSAYYLRLQGHEVSVFDQSDGSDNCSYGNAGYICPSHFIPLATPGIVKQGLKWMWNSRSPFYVEPRLDWDLIRWGWKFMRSATPKHVANAAAPLRDIALISQQAYADWHRSGLDFLYQHKGMLEIDLNLGGTAPLDIIINQPKSLEVNNFIDDDIFDMELTPNRGDCLSLIGLARDLAVFFGKSNSIDLFNGDIEPLEIIFENLSPNDCPKISFLEVEIEDSKVEYKSYLENFFNTIGGNKTNLFTDISNYISYVESSYFIANSYLKKTIVFN